MVTSWSGLLTGIVGTAFGMKPTTLRRIITLTILLWESEKGDREGLGASHRGRQIFVTPAKRSIP
jgi:hypothetical protein